MNKKILIIASMLFFLSGVLPKTYAQMMGSSHTASTTEIQKQQQEEAEGKQLFDKLQNNQIACDTLTDSDFEKIGEYAMGKSFGDNTAGHVAMNERIKQMQGETGEEQLHSRLGRNVTNCGSSDGKTTSEKGGGLDMMGSNGVGFMNGSTGFGGAFSGFWIVASITHLIIVIDLVLLGIWLWKQIKKK